MGRTAHEQIKSHGKLPFPAGVGLAILELTPERQGVTEASAAHLGDEHDVRG